MPEGSTCITASPPLSPYQLSALVRISSARSRYDTGFGVSTSIPLQQVSLDASPIAFLFLIVNSDKPGHGFQSIGSYHPIPEPSQREGRHTFQNCLLASFPPTLFRIFAPPGCSSTKSFSPYTEPSIIIYSPLSTVLCSATCFGVSDSDMVWIFAEVERMRARRRRSRKAK